MVCSPLHRFIHCPIDIIRFLRSTSYLKDIKKTNEALESAVESLFPDEAESLMSRARKVPARTILLAARVRLHCTARLLRRLEWDTIVKSTPQPCIHFAIGCAASPQIGLEIFDCIMYKVENGNVDTTTTRRLPLSTLGYGHAGLIDKLMALCWMVYLEFGPKLASMQYFFRRVRVMCSDMGTEMGMIDAPDVLPVFWHWLKTGRKDGVAVKEGSYLLPRAMFMPGWHHIWHKICKYVYKNISWYVGFLATLKACTTYFSRQGSPHCDQPSPRMHTCANTCVG